MKAEKQYRELSSCIVQSKQGEGLFSFIDNRPEAITQAKMINVIQLQIDQGNYNHARQILIAAGSISANNAHPIHGQPGGVPDHYGQQLVDEAQNDEANFRAAANHVAANQLRTAVRRVKYMFGFYN